MSHYHGSNSDYNYMANIQSDVVLSVFDFFIFIWCVVFCMILHGDLYCILLINVLPLEIQLSWRKFGSQYLVYPATFVFLSQTMIRIYTSVYVVVVNLLCSLIWGGGISCYWWNSWPSLCKLSFHNVCKWIRQMSELILLFAEIVYWENQDWTNAINFGCSYSQYKYVK